MLTEYTVLPEAALVRIPGHLTFQEASCLPCAAVTAWNALTGGRGLRSGETVLILGSGEVSLFALQFAKAFGARVIATTTSTQKAQRLLALGADEVINRRSTIEWHAVLSLLEAVGSAEEQRGGKVAVTLGSQTEYFDPPRHKDIDTQAVVSLRRMLGQAGYGPRAKDAGATGGET
jgi:NADPH:quinone reductase-like Zn-dependent oxidoreductase